MGIENPVHLIFLAAVALVVLGPKRLPEVARALGKSIREFREAISGEWQSSRRRSRSCRSAQAASSEPPRPLRAERAGRAA